MGPSHFVDASYILLYIAQIPLGHVIKSYEQYVFVGFMLFFVDILHNESYDTFKYGYIDEMTKMMTLLGWQQLLVFTDFRSTCIFECSYEQNDLSWPG